MEYENVVAINHISNECFIHCENTVTFFSSSGFIKKKWSKNIDLKITWTWKSSDTRSSCPGVQHSQQIVSNRILRYHSTWNTSNKNFVEKDGANKCLKSVSENRPSGEINRACHDDWRRDLMRCSLFAVHYPLHRITHRSIISWSPARPKNGPVKLWGVSWKDCDNFPWQVWGKLRLTCSLLQMAINRL